MPKSLQYLYCQHQNILLWGFIFHFFLFSIAVSAQPRVKFKRYSLEEGLSQSYVFCMLQDSRGFMWFGTEDGLNRFDGYHFKVYKNNPDNTTSLSYNNIRSLHEDKEDYIWLGTFRGNIDRFDRKTETFQRFNIDPENKINPTFKNISAIITDQQGTVWASSIKAGLYFLKRGAQQFSRLQQFDTASDSPINALALDEDHNLWIGTGNGLYQYNITTEKLIKHNISNNRINTLFIDRNAHLLIGTTLGLECYDLKNERFIDRNEILKNDSLLKETSIVAIHQDLQGQLWLGTGTQSLFVYNSATNHLQQFINNPSDPESISPGNIYSLEVDSEGGVWIGTRNGISRYDAKLHRFRHYIHEPWNPKSLQSLSVWNFSEDQQGLLWVNVARAGGWTGAVKENLQIPGIVAGAFDLNKGRLNKSELDPFILDKIVKPGLGFLHEDKYGRIWARGDGLYWIDRKTGKTLHYKHNPLDSCSLGDDWIMMFLKAEQDLIWLKTPACLSVYNIKTGCFENYYHNSNDPDKIGRSVINHFQRDYQGKIWLGTRSGGLMTFDHKKKKFTHFYHDPNDPSSISDDVIHDIYEDKKHRLWISTPNGLNLFDRKAQSFIHFREKDGLPNDYVYGILEDSKGKLWLSTNKGIARFDPNNKEKPFRAYDPEDGQRVIEFNDGSYYKSPITGLMFFGGVNGFTVFHPDSIRNDTFIPPVMITRFQYLTRTKTGAVFAEEIGISEKAAITLKHRQKTLLLFEFASLSYSKPGKNQYQYQLDGYSEDWIPLGTRREASFTNLAAGNYTLRVKGSNGDGIWNDTPTELKITILAPWYWNWLSKTIYLCLFVGAVIYFYRFQLTRRLAQAEAKRLRELDQVKTSLYTNITHEFRTPLTIILGMADKVEQAPRQWLQEGIQMIRRNGQSLLRLVNQMLDLSKLEAGSLPVNMVQGDIIRYLKTLLELFRSYADSKNIHLEFATEQEQFVMDYDADKVKDIISNLLSNALKFTPEEGSIKLAVGSEQFTVSSEQFTVGSESHLRQAYGDRRKLEGTEYIYIIVRDTGVGIPQEKLPHIFDRFYQADDSATRKGEGTGIGLALTKELVRLLDGTIEVESELGKGSVFQVQLPVRNTAPLLETTPAIEPAVTTFATTETATAKKGMVSLPQMLIVEDNADVISYLRSCLDNQYRIEVAYNGQEGINKAIEIVPDVIISDVMMPEKDGFELCRTLKEDMRTSHVPIILLTARADMNSRLKGLEGGADAYLTKPFNEQELEVSLRKSLELRQRLRERYTHDIPISPDDSFSRDDAFITKLHQVLEANYSDEDFNIPALAAAMELSHAQLGRKLHALLDTTPQLYLRHYRLQKAYHLLKHSDMSVKEVAFATGFSDPSYFSKTFLNEFQQNPSDLRG